MKQLRRSRDNRVLAGVMGGIGRYFDIDPTLVRLAYLLIALATGLLPAIIAYVVAIFVIPDDTPTYHVIDEDRDDAQRS
ncbi:MAG TPA: PspC domain-containing protein [Candidatus Paceibacterota bacterium]|nr:PspC domain-containing protein [Candidatus Paceibacterota bacterium]